MGLRLPSAGVEPRMEPVNLVTAAVSCSRLRANWRLRSPDRFRDLRNSTEDHADQLTPVRAVSATMRLAMNDRDGGVCEIMIDLAVGRAARCSSLTLLVAGECTFARARKVIAMQAISILAG